VTLNGSRWRRDFISKPDAIKWEAESKARLLNSLTPEMPRRGRAKADPLTFDGRPRTIQELAELVIERHWRRSKNSAKAAATAREVCKLIGPATNLNDIRVTTVDDLKAKLYDRGASSSTVNRKLAALSKMLSYAEEREWLDRRPKVKREREREHRIRFITEQEEAQMLAWATHRGLDWFHDLIVVGVDTGFRMGELTGLSKMSLGERVVTVWITKSGKPRTVPLTRRAEAALARRWYDEPFFHQARGRAFYDLWHAMRSELGIDDPQFVPHAMRHTFCSRLAMRGAHAKTIMELAGHSSIMVTQRYMHLAPATLRGAIDLLEAHQPQAPQVA
jgi:integrase